MSLFVRRLFLAATFAVACISGAQAEDKNTGRVVYDRDGDIYSSTLTGSDETPLTQNGDSHSPKWSPDGQKILFIRNTSLQTVTDADGNISAIGQPTDFYMMNRDGSDAHLVKHLDGVVSDPSWSPDGKKIGFYYQSKEEWLNQGIPTFISGFFELPIESDFKSEEKPRFISADARQVDWSPNGKKLVFAVARPANHVALHTSNTDGSDETQLLDEEVFANAQMAKWSADSEEIAFQAIIRRQMPDHKSAFQSAIFVVHPDGTHIHQLTYDLGWDCWHPWWSHTENRLTYSCYAMPGCMPAEAKAHPDQCIGRTFSVMPDDLHAKPAQIAEQKGVAGAVVPEVAAH